MHFRAAAAQIAYLISKHDKSHAQFSACIPPVALRPTRQARDVGPPPSFNTTCGAPSIRLESFFSLPSITCAIAPTLDRSWHGPCNKSFEQMLNLCEPKTRSSQLIVSNTT
jgi:hypothetical protein